MPTLDAISCSCGKALSEGNVLCDECKREWIVNLIQSKAREVLGHEVSIRDNKASYTFGVVLWDNPHTLNGLLHSAIAKYIPNMVMIKINSTVYHYVIPK